VLAPSIIGIPVDDTVHFISNYKLQLAKDGDVNAALRACPTWASSERWRSIFIGSLSDLFLLPKPLLS
jgi:hypothetical protein